MIKSVKGAASRPWDTEYEQIHLFQKSYAILSLSKMAQHCMVLQKKMAMACEWLNNQDLFSLGNDLRYELCFAFLHILILSSHYFYWNNALNTRAEKRKNEHEKLAKENKIKQKKSSIHQVLWLTSLTWSLVDITLPPNPNIKTSFNHLTLSLPDKQCTGNSSNVYPGAECTHSSIATARLPTATNRRETLAEHSRSHEKKAYVPPRPELYKSSALNWQTFQWLVFCSLPRERKS